ncbi:MAG: ATPase domain-containing protein, partial [Candidatus Bathyarchaeia archaeon]
MQHSSLDRLLKGGVTSGEILLVYGEAATGKTTFCLQAALAVAALDKGTFYIDGDGSLSPTRLNQLVEAYSSDRVASIGI